MKKSNWNTKVTDQEIVMMTLQRNGLDQQIKILQDSKAKVPLNFWITESAYYYRQKLLDNQPTQWQE